MTDPIHELTPEITDFIVRFEVPVCVTRRADAIDRALDTITDDHVVEVTRA